MKKIILSVILILLVFSLYGLEFDDYVIATAPALKVLLPIGMIPEMFIDSDSIIPGAIGLGLFTIPNSFLLYNVFTENPVGTSFWRKVTLYSDAAVCGAIPCRIRNLSIGRWKLWRRWMGPISRWSFCCYVNHCLWCCGCRYGSIFL